MLLQQLHCFAPVHGFDNFVLVTKHFTQNHAIHLGVIDNKQKRLAKFARLEGVDIGSHAAPCAFRAIHKPIGLLHGSLDGLAIGNNATDTHRKELVIIVRYRCLRHGIAYGVKAVRKGLLIDIRHHEQEFVTAETHEHIGVMHASLHCLHSGMQRQIARMMAHGVVHKLEIIQIDNGNARENTLVPQLVFIEAAIVYTRQRIGIQKMAISQVNFLFRSRYAQKHARVTGDTYIASRGLEAFAR